MILKEPDSIKTNDKYLKAGLAAEQKLSFYLKRAFANEDIIAVLNGIRIEHNNDVAQIDHLIIHKYGMVIVESKSVTSKVKINEDGSWERLWNNHYTGMPSPVLQAERQADFLKNFLNDNKEKLLGKFLGRQHDFKKMPIDILVAISDKGRIDRSEHPESKFVLKADQVAGRIKDLYQEQKKLDNPLAFSLKMPDWFFKNQEVITNIGNFLIENHSPLQQKKEEPEPHQTSEATEATPKVKAEHVECGINSPSGTCPECNTQMEIWSKYGYFWKCTECGKTVAIKEKCPQCNGNLKVRKQKHQYFIGCKECNIEGLYHEKE